MTPLAGASNPVEEEHMCALEAGFGVAAARHYNASGLHAAQAPVHQMSKTLHR